MSPQKKKKFEAALDNLFSSPRSKPKVNAPDEVQAAEALPASMVPELDEAPASAQAEPLPSASIEILAEPGQVDAEFEHPPVADESPASLDPLFSEDRAVEYSDLSTSPDPQPSGIDTPASEEIMRIEPALHPLSTGGEEAQPETLAAVPGPETLPAQDRSAAAPAAGAQGTLNETSSPIATRKITMTTLSNPSPEKKPAPLSASSSAISTPGSSQAPTPSEVENTEDIQLVVFILEEQQYGVAISIVESIIKMQSITPVPHASHYIKGVTNLRGRVLPVIDLRTRFGLNPVKITKDNRIIVINMKKVEVGMVVDAVSEVLSIPANCVEPTPSIATSLDSDYITGVAKVEGRLIIMLDVAKILSIQGQENDN